MKNTFKTQPRTITKTEIIIGLISFIIAGIGFIWSILQVWKFVDAVFGS
jgi:hypothetical protein